MPRRNGHAKYVRGRRPQRSKRWPFRMVLRSGQIRLVYHPEIVNNVEEEKHDRVPSHYR
jgi:hypothetical protein